MSTGVHDEDSKSSARDPASQPKRRDPFDAASGATDPAAVDALLDELVAWTSRGHSLDDFEPMRSLGRSASSQRAGPASKSGYVVTEPITAMPSRVLISDRPAPVVQTPKALVAAQVAALMDQWLDAFLDRNFDLATAVLEQVLALEPGHERALANRARQRRILMELAS